MSLTTAKGKAADLKVCYLDHGVPEVSIELQAGRPNIYDEYDALMVASKVSHHTVSRYSPNSLTPVLGLCKRGRSDVPGPLSNTYGGWDLTLRVLTFGYANHPGAGGPYLVPRIGGGSFRIPLDSMRRYGWGTEFEGGLSEADWDRELRNPRGKGRAMTFREFMGRVNAADMQFFGIHPDAMIEHRDWTMGNPRQRDPRKIDRLGYSRTEGKAEALRYANPDQGEDNDMALTEQQIERAVITGVQKALNASSIRELERTLTADAVERLLNTSRMRDLLRDQVNAATGDINALIETLTSEVRALRSEGSEGSK